jgi:hypothetical protein
MYVERSLEKKFDKAAELYNLVAVVGARQSGKTTLLKKKLQEKNGSYVSLDDPDARELFNEDIKKFEKQYLEAGRITGVDEVQYGREAGIKLKYLADKGYKLWVTSSSETLLGRDVLSYLVGRVSILRLYPFSLQEFRRAKKTEGLTEKIKERLVWEHVNYGGYPKVVLAEDFESKKILLKDLMDTMLLKDVSRTFAIEDISLLERLVRYLSINTGNIASYENITAYLGVSFQTLKKYLDAMEKSCIITRTLPYHTNKLKELSKKPKIYFIDTGLRNNILKSYSTEIEGKIFENYVLTELLKHGLQVKYWRTKNRAEVDFIVEEDSKLIPVEVKTRAEKAGRGVKSFIKAYKPEKAFVVRYNGAEREEIFEGCAITFTDAFGLLEKIT